MTLRILTRSISPEVHTFHKVFCIWQYTERLAQVPKTTLARVILGELTFHLFNFLFMEKKSSAFCLSAIIGILLFFWPISEFSLPLFQNEPMCEIFHMKISFPQMATRKWLTENRPPQISDANILPIISPPEYKPMDSYCYLF